MQTFLPFPGYRRSAAVLDNARLNKQRVEGMVILKSILRLRLGEDGRIPWMHHPALLMWYNNPMSLYKYEIAVCDEWVRRGKTDNCLDKTTAIFTTYQDLGGEINIEPPHWLGNMEFHLSHQSNLLRKDRKHYFKYFGDIPDNLPYFWPTHQYGDYDGS